jgi:polysaccharide export outer membrane protein
MDLIRAGGGLSESAYGGQAELTRYTIGENDARVAELIEIDLRAALEGDPAANLPLHAFDHVVIKEVPQWAVQEEVEIRGEVRFPGRYRIRRGETLRSVLERAGGLTERRQLEILASRMESDLAQLSLQAAQETGKDTAQALTIGRSLLANLRSTQAVGRLVIDLERAMVAHPGSEHDIVLKDGDRLVVPRVTQEVTVIGEVQSATSHLYNPNFSRDDYIAMSGGVTPRADEKHIYVVRANGSVEVGTSGLWFRKGGVQIEPGDTIVVPLDTERMRPLPFWTAVTTIIYNLAVAVAAVNSF